MPEGRTSKGRIKKGYKLTKGGRVVKASKRAKKTGSKRKKR